MSVTHTKMTVLDETGFVVLNPLVPPIASHEWLDLDYLDWKSAGDTEFAPIASALGDMECGGFWDHGKPDRDGIWTANAKRCGGIVDWVNSIGAEFGRVRVIKLAPQNYDEAMRQLHIDDNNRLNPPGQGWVVRAFLQLTDDPDSFAILRPNRDDSDGEVHVPLGQGTMYVVDTERVWHVVSHNGTGARYAVIACLTSGRNLEEFIASRLPGA